MTQRATFLIPLLFATLIFKGQDSLLKKPVQKGHYEIGVSVLSPFLLLAGATSQEDRYTNITARYVTPKGHAFKVFTGVAMLIENSSSYKQTNYLAANSTTVYPTTEVRTPSNFQVGFGYEYIIGKRKLKHAFGLDLLYNNKFIANRFYYITGTDSVTPSGHVATKIHRVDTGAYIHNYNLNKFGVNLSYSLRYEFSKHWLMTASFILAFKTYKVKEENHSLTNSDFNVNGLVSDISLFYRF